MSCFEGMIVLIEFLLSEITDGRKACTNSCQFVSLEQLTKRGSKFKVIEK